VAWAELSTQAGLAGCLARQARTSGVLDRVDGAAGMHGPGVVAQPAVVAAEAALAHRWGPGHAFVGVSVGVTARPRLGPVPPGVAVIATRGDVDGLEEPDDQVPGRPGAEAQARG